MSHTYKYSVAQAFPNHKVAVDALAQEIADSSIQNQLQIVNAFSDDCKIVFASELSTADKVTLDGSSDPEANPTCPNPPGSIIGDHQGVPLHEHNILLTKIVENNLLDPDDALSATDGQHVVVKSGQDYTDHAISYPYQIDVVAARYFIPIDQASVKDGDRFHIIGIPGGDPFVGYVTQSVSQGETVIPVSATVFTYLRHGLDFRFVSHGTIYQIKSEDAQAGTLTLFEGLTQDITVGDLLLVRRFMCRDIRPSKGVVVTIGDLNPGSAGLCANAQMIVRYIPEAQPPADFTLSLELIYSY